MRAWASPQLALGAPVEDRLVETRNVHRVLGRDHPQEVFIDLGRLPITHRAGKTRSLR